MAENMILSSELYNYCSITFNFRLKGWQTTTTVSKDIFLDENSKAYIYIERFDEDGNLPIVGNIHTEKWYELKWSNLTGSHYLHTYVDQNEYNAILYNFFQKTDGLLSNAQYTIIVDGYWCNPGINKGLKYSFVDGTIIPSNGNENIMYLQENYCILYPYFSVNDSDKWYSGTRYEIILSPTDKKVIYNYNGTAFAIYTKKDNFEVIAQRIGKKTVDGKTFIKGTSEKPRISELIANNPEPTEDFKLQIRHTFFRDGFNDEEHKSCLGFKPGDEESDGMLVKPKILNTLFNGWSASTNSQGLQSEYLNNKEYDVSNLFLRLNHMEIDSETSMRISYDNSLNYLKVSDIYGPKRQTMIDNNLIPGYWYPDDCNGNEPKEYVTTNSRIIEKEITIKSNTINVSNETFNSFVGLHQVGDTNYTILKSSLALGSGIIEDDILGNKYSTQQMHDVTLGAYILANGDDSCTANVQFCGGSVGGDASLCVCDSVGLSDICSCDLIADCKDTGDSCSDDTGDLCISDTGDSCSDDTGEIQPQYPSTSDVTFISSGGPMSVYLSLSTFLNKSFYIKFGDDKKIFLANYISLALTPNKTYNNTDIILKNCKPVYFIPDNVWEQYVGQTISIGECDFYNDKLDLTLVYKENKFDTIKRDIKITTLSASDVECAVFNNSNPEFIITGDKWEDKYSTIEFNKSVNVYLEEQGVLYPIMWNTQEIEVSNLISRDMRTYIEPTSQLEITINYEKSESDGAIIIGVFKTDINTSATTLLTYINYGSYKVIDLPRTPTYKIWFSPIAGNPGMTSYGHQLAIHQYFMEIISESNATRKKENVIWNGETMSNSSLNDNNSFFIDELLGNMSGNKFDFNLKIKNFANGYEYCAIEPHRDTNNNNEQLVFATPLLNGSRYRTYSLYSHNGKLVYYEGDDFYNYGGVELFSLVGDLNEQINNPNASAYTASVQWLGSNNQVVTRQTYRGNRTIKTWAHLCNGHDGGTEDNTYKLIVTNGGTNIPI